ncbi:MAG: hypothetical protein AAF633_21995, partial [Chloroflexota bacterium]
FQQKDDSPSPNPNPFGGTLKERFMRTLNITGTAALFLGGVSVFQGVSAGTETWLTHPSSSTVILGIMSLVARILVLKEDRLAYLPITIALLYPISYSLTTGRPFNIIILFVCLFFLYRIYQIYQGKSDV